MTTLHILELVYAVLAGGCLVGGFGFFIKQCIRDPHCGPHSLIGYFGAFMLAVLLSALWPLIAAVVMVGFPIDVIDQKLGDRKARKRIEKDRKDRGECLECGRNLATTALMPTHRYNELIALEQKYYTLQREAEKMVQKAREIQAGAYDYARYNAPNYNPYVAPPQSYVPKPNHYNAYCNCADCNRYRRGY